jgi:uncharacterized membrane protein
VVGPTRRGSARSRLARFLLFEKVDYLQWIGTAAAFFFVTILVVAFLPGSAVFERPTMLLPSRRAGGGRGGGGYPTAAPSLRRIWREGKRREGRWWRPGGGTRGSGGALPVSE